MNPESEEQLYLAEWSIWAKRVATVVLIVLAFLSFTLLRPIGNLLVVSLLLAFLLFAPIQFLTRRLNLPYPLAVLISFMVYFAVIVFAVLRLGPPIARSVENISNTVIATANDTIIRIRAYTPTDPDRFGLLEIDRANNIVIDFGFIVEPISALLKGEPAQNLDVRQIVESVIGAAGGVAGSVLGTLGGLLSGFFELLFAHFVALLLLLEIPGLHRALVKMEDPFEREFAILFQRIYAVWVGFLRGQVIVGIIVGGATWFQLRVMGIPNAELVGVIAGVVSLIPTIGSLIALVPVALAPLIGGASAFPELERGTLILITVIVNILITQTFVMNVIAPRIVGSAVRLPVPIIILGLFVGAAFGGVLGALLVAPIMGTARVVIEYVLLKIRGGDPYPGEERPVLMLDEMFNRPTSQAQR